MQQGPKQAIVAKFGIGYHARDSKSAGPDLAQQRHRLPPFCVKPDRPRDARLRARGVGKPLLGQIQRGTQQIRPDARPQCRGDRHLAIGDFPQGAAVLPRHPDRLTALFGKARAIENQQAFAFRNHRAQATPHRVGVPRRVGNEVLEGLVRSRLRHPRQHGFHRFARAVAEQPLDVPSQRKHLGAMAEAFLERFQPRHQPTQLIDGAAIVHPGVTYRILTPSTMSSNSITVRTRVSRAI
jgi:hypothetical protein